MLAFAPGGCGAGAPSDAGGSEGKPTSDSDTGTTGGVTGAAPPSTATSGGASTTTDPGSSAGTGSTTSAGSTGNADPTAATGTTGGGAGPCHEVPVATVPELHAALSAAAPGDCILLDPGRYEAIGAQTINYAGADRSVYFAGRSSGRAEAPIEVRSRDPQDKATLVGVSTEGSGYVLWINGENWIVRDLAVENGGKGIVLDEASGSLLSGVEVRRTGDEGIHLRSGTSDAVVEDCTVEDTGLVQPGFGEGIYIGSDNSQWDKYDPGCHDNLVTNCTVRGTRAEGVDIKEGTSGNRVEHSEFHGDAISGDNSADSFIDLKGAAARVEGNVFHQAGNPLVTRGVAIVERPQGPTAIDNWIFDNTYAMDDASGWMVHAYAGRDNYAWNNTRNPAGDEYKGNEPELYLFDPR